MDFPWLVCALTLTLLSLSFQSALLCSPNGYETLTATQGHLSSPNYPKYNPAATKCQWLISLQHGHVIHLAFQAFDVGQASECLAQESRKTFVEVRDGTKNVSIGMWCGSSTPQTISSSTSQMWILYVTNGYKSTKFAANYTTTKDSSQAVIIILALAAIGGTIVCIVIAVVLIKRRNLQSDDDIPSSRDNHLGDKDERACAVPHIPSLTLLGAINKGMDGGETESAMSGQINSEHNSVSNGTLKSNLHNIQNSIYHNYGLSGSLKQNMDDLDTDNVYIPSKNGGITTPTDGHSVSISVLTTAKVIFVQDSSRSSSSRSSS